MKTFQTETEAIKNAKNRAKTEYRTQYIYPTEGGFHVRSQQSNTASPILKVRYDGDVIDLRKEQAQ